MTRVKLPTLLSLSFSSFSLAGTSYLVKKWVHAILLSSRTRHPPPIITLAASNRPLVFNERYSRWNRWEKIKLVGLKLGRYHCVMCTKLNSEFSGTFFYHVEISSQRTLLKKSYKKLNRKRCTSVLLYPLSLSMIQNLILFDKFLDFFRHYVFSLAFVTES